MEQVINLKLSVSEVNLVLASLAKQPFDQVANLIRSIQEQGSQQLQEQQAPVESEG